MSHIRPAYVIPWQLKLSSSLLRTTKHPSSKSTMMFWLWWWRVGVWKLPSSKPLLTDGHPDLSQGAGINQVLLVIAMSA
jgi:hypothetical protein